MPSQNRGTAVDTRKAPYGGDPRFRLCASYGGYLTFLEIGLPHSHVAATVSRKKQVVCATFQCQKAGYAATSISGTDVYKLMSQPSPKAQAPISTSCEYALPIMQARERGYARLMCAELFANDAKLSSLPLRDAKCTVSSGHPNVTRWARRQVHHIAGEEAQLGYNFSPNPRSDEVAP